MNITMDLSGLNASVDELLNLLESRLPANPNSVKSKKLTNSLEKVMADYFRNLEKAMPNIDMLYYKYVEV